MKRVAVGLASFVLLVVLLVGIPAALVALVGNPIPSWDALVAAMTLPDYTGSFLIGTIMPIAAWIAWATFAIGFLLELPNQLHGIRRRPTERRPVRGFGLQQKLMGGLLAAVIAIFTPAVAFAAPTTASTGYTAVSSTMTVQNSQDVVAGVDTLAAAATAEATPVAAPPESPAAEATVVVEVPRTIVSGDTLWDISEQTLGDGARYPEIFDASADVVQPGGETITDPDLIYPGQVVEIPTIVPAPYVGDTPDPVAPNAATGSGVDGTSGADTSTNAAGQDAGAQDVASGADADVSTDAGAAAGASGTAPGSSDSGNVSQGGVGAGTMNGNGLGYTTDSQPSSAADPTPQAAEAPVSNDIDEADDAWVASAATGGGIGAVVAAGLLSLLWWRRAQQRRTRKPRQRLALPEETVSTVELELRAVENPAGADAVDAALRTLAVWAQDTGARLPVLYALRLDETTIAVYLDEEADLPAPFTPYDPDDKLAWKISLTDITPPERTPAAPYPALVMLGQDDDGGHVFVDLEQVGALQITGGSEDLRRAALTAVAIELAANTWSENVQVTLVGVTDPLPLALGSGRVRHVEDTDTLLRNLHGQVEAADAAFAALRVAGPGQARTVGADAESWAPEILILGDDVDRATRTAIGELVTRLPPVGIAAVSAGSLTGDWALELTDDQHAQLHMAGTDTTIPLRPQTIGAREHAELLGLFQTATHAPATGEALQDEIPLDEIPPADFEHPTVDEQLEATPDAVDENPAADSDEDRQRVNEDDETPLAAVTPMHRGLYVQMLGQVTVHGARGEVPTNPNTAKQWASMKRRGTELVVFLQLHPQANKEQVHAAFWPGEPADGPKAASDRSGLMTKTRRWLGQDDNARMYLPHVIDGIYQLADGGIIRSDWDDFQALVGEDITTASTAHLLGALRLVKDQPLTGVPDNRYGFADRVRQEMIALIGDVAHEVCTRSLATRKVTDARMAAAIARMVDPVNEVFWRDSLRAEHQAGDQASVNRLITQLRETFAAFEEDELDPDTEQLIDQLSARHAIAS